MAKAERKVSPVNDKMYEAEGQSPIQGQAPGTANKTDVHLEDLGKLSDFPSPVASDNPEDGTGEYVVVLADFLSGAGPDDIFKKGDVRRLSRIITGYDDPEVSRDVVKGRIKRFFDNKAIRLATKDEQGVGSVEVTYESESNAVQTERQRRIKAEQEADVLRQQLAQAGNAMVNATPTQAGASDSAKQATIDEGTTKENDWE